MINLIVL